MKNKRIEYLGPAWPPHEIRSAPLQDSPARLPAWLPAAAYHRTAAWAGCHSEYRLSLIHILQIFHKVQRLNDRHRRPFIDVLAAHAHAQRHFVQPLAAALRTWRLRHKRSIPFARHRRGCFDKTPLDQRLDAFNVIVAAEAVAGTGSDAVSNRFFGTV